MNCGQSMTSDPATQLTQFNIMGRAEGVEKVREKGEGVGKWGAYGGLPLIEQDLAYTAF